MRAQQKHEKLWKRHTGRKRKQQNRWVLSWGVVAVILWILGWQEAFVTFVSFGLTLLALYGFHHGEFCSRGWCVTGWYGKYINAMLFAIGIMGLISFFV